MRVKFGSIITEGHGSIGGHTIQQSRFGHLFHTKVMQRKQPTSKQLRIRSINKKLQSSWRLLPIADREVWNIYAVTHKIYNKHGDKSPLSGHSLWMKYNFQYANLGVSLITNPFDYVEFIAGNEIVINGEFNTADNWIFTGGFTFNVDKASFSGVGGGFVFQFNTINLDTVYLVEFDISDSPGTCDFRLITTGGNNVFEPPLNGHVMLPNGHHAFLVKCIYQSTNFFFAGQDIGGAFSIDNISIKPNSL